MRAGVVPKEQTMLLVDSKRQRGRDAGGGLVVDWVAHIVEQVAGAVLPLRAPPEAPTRLGFPAAPDLCESDGSGRRSLATGGSGGGGPESRGGRGVALGRSRWGSRDPKHTV